MKRQFTLTVQQFDPIEDREMGTTGGFKVTCREFWCSSAAPTLDEALHSMARMIEFRITPKFKLNPWPMAHRPSHRTLRRAEDVRTKTTCVAINMGPKEIKIVADAIGSLAERVALDCDHHNMNHKEWYRAVRRARKLLSVTLTNQPHD